MAPLRPLTKARVAVARVKALIDAACQHLSEGVPQVEGDKIHRLDKADTKMGSEALRTMAGIGVPYAMLLYERFLGRPFAGHRDSVSELVGVIWNLQSMTYSATAGLITGRPNELSEFLGSIKHLTLSSPASSIHT